MIDLYSEIETDSFKKSWNFKMFSILTIYKNKKMSPETQNSQNLERGLTIYLNFTICTSMMYNLLPEQV
jgi:hypothetical protein